VVSTSVFGVKRRDAPVVLLKNIALANDPQIQSSKE
jgi:hypothetical protein